MHDRGSEARATSGIWKFLGERSVAMLRFDRREKHEKIMRTWALL